jgi:hypothetical protein
MRGRFQLQNYNEFSEHIRWHDYISIMINEFPVVLVRKYDDPHETRGYYWSAFLIQIMGFKVYQKVRQ